MIGHSERALLERLYARVALCRARSEGPEAKYWNQEDLERETDILLALIALLERG